MKETKLEEGEACDDTTVDPDIALSYIDEKLQDVLGHFQKDFEDGVSSENLGSKFGGYGSFLPTYQRSPSWTCTKTPPEAYHNDISKSPSNLRPEGGRRPSSASSSTSLSGRPLALKTPAANGKTNPDEDSTSKSDIVKKPTNLSDKKAPQLHNKVGNEDLSTQKKAEIYSGLGLDVSPSSSPDDSPMNNEGLSHDLKDSRSESPTSILQIMTSYPLHDGLLLSPLSDDLICLTEKVKLWGKCGSQHMIQGNLENSVALVNGAHCAKNGSEDMKKKHVTDRYREFFGDIKAEEDDVETGLQEIHSPEMLKVSDAVGHKSLVERNSSIKERVNVGKTENPCPSGEYPILASNGPTSVDAWHTSQENPSIGVQAIDSSGKTRYGLKVSSTGTKQDGSQSSNFQENPNCRSSSGTSHSVDENFHQHLGLPNSSVVEKRRHKNKEKKISLDNHSDEDMKDAKIRDKYTNRNSANDSKKDLVSAKNPEAHISDVSMRMERCDSKNSLTKRKGSELRDSLTCNPQDSMEKICDDICRKEKKARVSKFDQKDTSTSYSPSVKAADSSKRDLCNLRPSIAVSSACPTSSPKRSSDGENNGFSNQSSIVKKDNACNGKSYDLEFSEADLEEKDVHRESGKSAAKLKAKTMVSGYATHQDADVNACKTENLDQGSDKDRKNDHQCQNSGSVSNGRRGSSSRHKEKKRAPKSDSDQNHMPLDEEKTAPGKNKSQERSDVGSDRFKKSSKKDPSGKLLDKNVKGDNQSRFGHHDDAEVRSDVKRQAALPDRDDQRLSKKLVTNKSEQIEVSSKSPLTRDQSETLVFKEPVPESERENGANLVAVDAFERERSNASRQNKKAKTHHGNLPNSTANKVRDLDVPSPARKDSSSQAATNAIKEATNLKHLADRLKNSGLSESTGIYFQAALKFLHGASLLELDSSKHGEVNQSRRIYSSTAKLCQFCGHEYEKLKDMAAAALAYKCMEVAHMRVIYSSQSDANRYRNELQTALQIFPPVDKAASAKVVGSPQVAGTHVVSARNGSSFMRLINLAQEVNFAMEASRKSRVAFAAANPGPGDSQLSVKKALDFNFQDVDGLVRLVRVAMEAISH
ncbi:cysteine-tryptophan domain-containing zinc finger protein 7-like isoform X2 [Lycium ferocissimum]|uniref:cysteine-tryptophan domain-containing zinc finger protein 7-like isoform X2 n=1 Tax=Lycium ferocissimum TaxID=112874 RepID=UPI00281649F9|nr:cysteine-tryptophan domain-containing zinc finger protein 7-like isoform X2 [Lycium ferocissimum]